MFIGPLPYEIKTFKVKSGVEEKQGYGYPAKMYPELQCTLCNNMIDVSISTNKNNLR